jgi:hypothetical protein
VKEDDIFVRVLSLKIYFSHGDSMKGQNPCSLQFFKTLLDVEVSTSTNCEGSLKQAHLGDSTMVFYKVCTVFSEFD